MTPAQPTEPSDRKSFGILAAPNMGMPPAGDEEEPEEEEEKEQEQEHNDGAAAADRVGDGTAAADSVGDGADDGTTWSTAAVYSRGAGSELKPKKKIIRSARVSTRFVDRRRIRKNANSGDGT